MTVITHSTEVSFILNPYEHQVDLFHAYNTEQQRHGVCVWHRRGGKDAAGLTLTAIKSQMRVGTYYYFYPTYKLAKRALWDEVTEEGIPMRYHVPEQWIVHENETELRMELRNGSAIQLIGADTIKQMDRSIRSSNPVGAVFSEYQDMQRGIELPMLPIFAKNKGWELYLFTPKGHNHAHDLWQNVTDPHNEYAHTWFSSLKTIADTRQLNGRPIIEVSELDAMRGRGIREEFIQQEFYCSFEGWQEGSFFGDQMALAFKEDRVGRVPWIPEYPVHTVSDLGVGLKFATWFWQEVGHRIHLIHYYELPSGAIPEFAKYLKTRPYVYGDNWAPFDVDATEIGTGVTRIETAQDYGIFFHKLHKIHRLGDRISAGRAIFSRCYFDAVGTKKAHTVGGHSGIDVLQHYRREYDEDKQEYKESEVHDWASHGGSSFCYMGMAIGKTRGTQDKQQTHAITKFDPVDQVEYGEHDPNLYESDFDPFEDQR